MKMTKEEIIEINYPEGKTLLVDGFDDALIGVDVNSERAVYSVKKCIQILMEHEGMEYSEAVEFFYFNTAGAYVGEMTPIWVEDQIFDDYES